MKPAIKRVLLSRTDRLGDVILSTPVASAIKAASPDTEVYFLARRYVASVLEMHPHVDGVVILEETGSLPETLHRKGFEAVVALYPRPQLAWAFLRAGIPLRIGTGYRWYSVLFNQRVYEHRKDALRHEAEYNLRVLQPLGIVAEVPEFYNQLPAASVQQARARLAADRIAGDFVILHPGSGGSARDWPPEYFAALADRIQGELQLPVIFTGSAHERALVKRTIALSRTRSRDWSGQLTIPQLAVLQAEAALFVSNSTGPLHLARMMSTPVVAFYPPIRACRPERWGPYGCRDDVLMSQQAECFKCRRSPARACDCMLAITVEAAFEKVAAKLRATMPGSKGL